MALKCFRCGNVYRRQEGYGHVSWGQGETAYDQLKSWSGHKEICDHCLETLKAWLGIYPPPHETAQPDTGPTEPFSCFDSRLSYHAD